MAKIQWDEINNKAIISGHARVKVEHHKDYNRVVLQEKENGEWVTHGNFEEIIPNSGWHSTVMEKTKTKAMTLARKAKRLYPELGKT